MSRFFYVLLNFEPAGVVQAAEKYIELFENSYFIDFPTVI